jgi:hypothetical protein
MKMSLLDMTQDILSDMDSDLVNSIDDTPEAQQVAQIIKSTYTDLINTMDWPSTKSLFQLNAATVSKPTHCKLPVNVVETEWVMYDVRKEFADDRNFVELTYMYPDEFIKYVRTRKSNNDNVDIIVDDSDVELLIINDKQPQYWTSFDDSYLVMDSYNSDIDSFLQNSKFSCYGEIHPEFVMSDEFVPAMPVEGFSLLLNEAKSRAFARLAQQPDTKSEQQAQRARARMSRNNWRAKGGVRYPNYGRRSVK